MNLAEYRAEVKERLGVPAADTTQVSDTSLDRAINGALKHIATSHQWPWLFTEDELTLVSGANSFYPPGAWVKTHYVLVDERELGLRTVYDLHRYLGAATAVPRMYAVLGDRILVAPATNTDRTVRHGYTRSETPLIVSTDAPLLPDAHSEWLICEAGIRIAIRTNNTERIGQLREEAVVAKKAAMDNVTRTAGLPPIRRTKPSIWQDV